VRHRGATVEALRLDHEGRLSFSVYDLQQRAEPQERPIPAKLISEQQGAVPAAVAAGLLEEAFEAVQRELPSGHPGTWPQDYASWRGRSSGTGVIVTVPRIKYQTPWGNPWYDTSSSIPADLRSAVDRAWRLRTSATSVQRSQ